MIYSLFYSKKVKLCDVDDLIMADLIITNIFLEVNNKMSIVDNTEKNNESVDSKDAKAFEELYPKINSYLESQNSADFLSKILTLIVCVREKLNYPSKPNEPFCKSAKLIDPMLFENFDDEHYRNLLTKLIVIGYNLIKVTPIPEETKPLLLRRMLEYIE